MPSSETRLEVAQGFRDKAKVYSDLARKEAIADKLVLASLYLRTSQGLTVCAKAIEVGGLPALKSGNICVQAVAAFTHGSGPRGIRSREIKRFTRDGVRGRSNFRPMGVINYADKITRRQPDLKCEALTIQNPVSEADLMEQLTSPRVMASWMLQRRSGIIHLVAIPNVSGLKQNEVFVFDTAPAELPLSTRSAQSLLVDGLGLISDDGSRLLCGVSFLAA